MGFRKSRDTHRHERKWEAFREANRSLLHESGLPRSYVEQQEMFDDFLMHGGIDHHEDPIGFTVDKMTDAQRRSLRDLIHRYFEAGYSDPGIMVLGCEEKQELERMYPDQFAKPRN